MAQLSTDLVAGCPYREASESTCPLYAETKANLPLNNLLGTPHCLFKRQQKACQASRHQMMAEWCVAAASH